MGNGIKRPTRNPFKLKGSWIGAIVVYLIEVLYLFAVSNLINFGNGPNIFLIVVNTFSLNYLFLTIFAILVGFIIGYLVSLLKTKKVTKK